MATTTNLVKKSPYTSLVITALLCGLLWRLEVEYHGWKGLIWLSYFHWAIPASFALFLAWTIQLLEMNFFKKLILCALTTAYAATLFLLVQSLLYYMFASGPRAMLLLAEGSPSMMNPSQSITFLILLVPISIGLLIRIFELKVPVKYIVLSIIGVIASVPVAIGLLALFHHKGSPDFIHTIKSGFLIPLWVFSVGILFVKQEVKL